MSLSRAHGHFGRSIAVGPVPSEADGAVVLGVEEAVLPMLVERSKLNASRME
jgi:hypothetical protein